MAEIRTILTAEDQTAAALGSARERLGDLNAEANNSPARFSAMGAAVGAAAGTAVGFLSDAARAADEGARSEAQLALAIENSGASWDTHSESLLNAVDAAQMKFAFDDGDARTALQRLVELTGDAAGANDNLAIAMDLARAKGIPLEQAATLVGKAAAGNDGVFRRLGLTFGENATQQEKMAALQAVYAGQAEVFASSTGAQIDILKMKFGEWQEGVGASLGAMQPLFVALPGVGAMFTTLSGVVTGTVMPALGALGIGLGPILLVIGAVALAAGLLYLAWQSNFGGIQEKTQAVVGWLTDVAWPAVSAWFVDIAARVGEFFSNWETNFAGVLSLTQTVWGVISDVFTTVMTLIVGVVRDNWGAISTIIDGAWTLVQGYVKVGFSVIQGLFNTVLALLRGDWQGAWDAMKLMVANVWDGIKLMISGALTVIQGYLTLAWSAIQTAASTAWGAISTLAQLTWDAIKAAITGRIDEAKTSVSDAVGAIKGFFTAGWSAVESAVSGVWSRIGGYISAPIQTAKGAIDIALGAIKSALNAVISGINTFIGAWNTLPGTSDIPTIPGLASGGTVTTAGAYWVGEAGPERVLLPAGARVVSNRESRAMSGGGNTVNIYQQPGETGDALVSRVFRELDRRDRMARSR